MSSEDEKVDIETLAKTDAAFEKFLNASLKIGVPPEQIDLARREFTGGHLTAREMHTLLMIQQDFNLSVAEAVIAVWQQDAAEASETIRRMLEDIKKMNKAIRDYRETHLANQTKALEVVQAAAAALAGVSIGGHGGQE